MRNNIIKTKIKNGSVEIFNYDKKIKSIGTVGANISEINTVDPRFVSIWNYNPNIIINLYFKTKNIFKGNLKDFIVLCPDAKISSQLFYKMLLLPFPTIFFDGKKGFGPKRFIRYLHCMNDEWKSFDDINIDIDKLVRGIA